jgi:hypothetical protein
MFIPRTGSRNPAILLGMHDNPAVDWQALAEHYRSLYDRELENLAADFGSLTETARQVLRTELKNRGLAEPGAKAVAGAKAAAVRARPELFANSGFRSAVDPEAGVSRSREFDAKDGDERPTEFTWKMPLCECDSAGRAWEIHKALQQAGIESWVEEPGRDRVRSPRVVVAADQLEEAQEIAARPIPQETVDAYSEEIPEFVAPQCPSCGAEDPVLESAEPTNSWLCEACGKQWTEPAVEGAEEP